MSTHRTSILWTTVALAYGALILFPVFWMATMVVKPTDVMFARPTVFLFEPTLAHFDYVIREGFLHSLVTSFLLCSVSTLLVVLIGTPAAYAFARFEMKAKDDLFLFILATRMAPPVCLVIPFYLIFAKVGLLDTFLGLTIAYLTFNLSFYVWVLRSFCRDLPVELEEAAELEGWSKLQIFRRIIFPLLRNGIIATAVLCFIFAWNEFLFAFMLGGKALQTLPVAIPKADHHARRALGRAGGHRHGRVAAGAGRRGLPATPHRPRTDARGGEGIARPAAFSQHSFAIDHAIRPKQRRGGAFVSARHLGFALLPGVARNPQTAVIRADKRERRLIAADCHTYSSWRGLEASAAGDRATPDHPMVARGAYSMHSYRMRAPATRGVSFTLRLPDASISDIVISLAPARARSLMRRRALLAGTMLAGAVMLAALPGPARADGGAGGAGPGSAGGAGGVTSATVGGDGGGSTNSVAGAPAAAAAAAPARSAALAARRPPGVSRSVAEKARRSPARPAPMEPTPAMPAVLHAEPAVVAAVRTAQSSPRRQSIRHR